MTFPAVSTLSVTMSSVLEEGLIFEEPKDLLEFKVRESNVLGEEWLNALVEVVEVEVEVEQVDAGSVMVRSVYTRQEAMNPGKIVRISCDEAHFLDLSTMSTKFKCDTCGKGDDNLRPGLLDQECCLTNATTSFTNTSRSTSINRFIRGQILICRKS